MNSLASSKSAQTLRVFVVEDNDDTRKCLKKQLERRGHAVITASCMGDALRDLPLADCDVLLSDIGLPDGDGWQLLTQVHLPRPVYAIAMSGYGMASDLAKSHAAGYRHHLIKPFPRMALDAVLAEALQEVHQRKAVEA